MVSPEIGFIMNPKKMFFSTKLVSISKDGIIKQKAKVIDIMNTPELKKLLETADPSTKLKISDLKTWKDWSISDRESFVKWQETLYMKNQKK